MSDEQRGPRPQLPGQPPFAGITGDLGDITTFAQLRNLLDRYYLPANLVAPPGATGNGGRTTVVTNGPATPYVISVNGQSGVVILQTGDIPHVYSVLSYGAIGNGVADDTVAIQAAIAAAEADPAIGIVFFPGGTYLTTATLTITQPIALIGEPQIGIYGAGQGSTAILTHNTGADTFFFNGAGGQITGIVISDIQIRAASGASGTGANAWHFVNGQIVRMSRCSVSGVDNGFLFAGTGGVECYDCSFQPSDRVASGRSGFKSTAAVAGNSNQTTLTNCSVTQAGQANIRNINGYALVSGYQSLTLINCYANGCINGVVMTSDGGSVPNYLVADTFTAEACLDGIHIVNGNPVQVTNYFGLSTVGNDIQVDSTVAAGAEIMFANAMVGPCSGNAFQIDGPVDISIVGGVLGVGAAIKNGIVINAAANVAVSGVTMKNVAGSGGLQGYGVWLTALAAALVTVTGCTFISTAHSPFFATIGATAKLNANGCTAFGSGVFDIDIIAATALVPRFIGNNLPSVNGLTTPAVPATGVGVKNIYGKDAMVYAGGDITSATIDGNSVPAESSIGGPAQMFRIVANSTIAPSYTSTLQWAWVFDP